MKLITVVLIACFSMLSPTTAFDSSTSGETKSSESGNPGITVTESKTLSFQTANRLRSDFSISIPKGAKYVSHSINIEIGGNPDKTRYNDYYCFCSEPLLSADGETVSFECVDFDVEQSEKEIALRFYQFERAKFFTQPVHDFLGTAQANTNRRVEITVDYEFE